MPFGRPVRTSSAGSTPQAPSRMTPSRSTAGVQADAGTSTPSWWIARTAA
ncbi:hypothetical protein M2271_000972 [Streptomyces sp. LBL]|nr:hypothetical protein [Streptomyces sp. LBL]